MVSLAFGTKLGVNEVVLVSSADGVGGAAPVAGPTVNAIISNVHCHIVTLLRPC